MLNQNYQRVATSIFPGFSHGLPEGFPAPIKQGFFSHGPDMTFMTLLGLVRAGSLCRTSPGGDVFLRI